MKEINIAETEWKIMEVLWMSRELTIGEIRAKLHDTGWSDSTIKTLVRRLCAKGAVTVNENVSPFLYSAAVNELDCKKSETRSFIDKVYHGSLKLLMANLVSDTNITKEDEKKLMEIIERMEDAETK